MNRILGRGQTLTTPRLTIEAAMLDDLPTHASWLTGALKPEWEPDDLEPWLRDGLGLRLVAEGETIGLAVVALERPESGAAAVPFIAVRPERRFRGLGGEGAIAIERDLRDRGFDRVFAAVPDSRGLAVYFWLRLGFRPLLREEAPWPLVGLSGDPPAGIWLLRDRD